MGLSLGLAVLLAAPQLWLTLQYLPQSMRAQGWSHSQFLDGSIAVSEALTWLVPGSFGWQMPTYHGAMADCFTSEYFGLLPWALAFAALASLWRGERLVRWMAALAACAFFFAQRDWTPFYGVFHRVPVLSGFRIWCRVLFLLTFAVCVLAAYGWDALRSQRTRSAALRGTVAFTVLALASAAFCWYGAHAAAASAAGLPFFVGLPVKPEGIIEALTALTRDSARMTLSLLPFVAALLWLGTKRWNVVVLLALALAFHVVDQHQVIGRFVQFMDPRAGLAYPDYAPAPPPPAGPEPWRIYDDDVAHPNNNIFLGYENLEGRESLPLTSYERIWQAMRGRGKDWNDLMNERYLFVHGSGDRVTIYRNRDAFPRAWLVGRSVRVEGDEQAYRLLADPAFKPRDQVALSVDPGLAPAPRASAKSPQGSVVWLDRSPQTASLDVSTDRDAVLVMSNAWYPSWRCLVDGRDTVVLKADGGLQAVVVRAGRHTVDFHFDNGFFYDSLAACLAGLTALVGLAWI